jgi:hypothetical protein
LAADSVSGWLERGLLTARQRSFTLEKAGPATVLMHALKARRLSGHARTEMALRR